MSYRDRITLEPGKRGGRPCIRSMRITVYDVLGWLAAGMSRAEILEDFPVGVDDTADLGFERNTAQAAPPGDAYTLEALLERRGELRRILVDRKR